MRRCPAGLGRHRNHHHVAAEILGHHFVLDQLLLHPVRVGVVLVDLVDRNHQRHLGGARVLDRLDRLRHHAVVGSHHQHHDVGELGATRTHRGEGRVARRIEEGNHAFLGFDVVRADVLGDAAGLARRHLGATDVVEQRGLAVVDMAHDRDDRRTGMLLALHFLAVRDQRRLGIVVARAHRRVAEFLDHQHRGVVVDHLVDRHHHAHLEQRLHHFAALERQLRGKVGHADGVAEPRLLVPPAR
jgi:hypothetical protein